jgi:hypothetical protein
MAPFIINLKIQLIIDRALKQWLLPLSVRRTRSTDHTYFADASVSLLLVFRKDSGCVVVASCGSCGARGQRYSLCAPGCLRLCQVFSRRSCFIVTYIVLAMLMTLRDSLLLLYLPLSSLLFLSLLHGIAGRLPVRMRTFLLRSSFRVLSFLKSHK